MRELIKLFAFIILSLISILSFAQDALKHAQDRSLKNEKKNSIIPEDQLNVEQCAFNEANLRESELPGSKSIEEREVEFDAYMKNSNPVRLDGEVKTIPIVVHIVHTGEAEGVGNNISNAQVYSAVTQLNDRFRKTPGTHGDADGVDTEIEFCLASIDPDGNPTTGIVRVDGSTVSGYEDGGICVISSQCVLNELAVKNLSRWPNTEYYNIWVVSEIQDNNGGFGIQGFAYLPGSSSLYDGTVIMNTCFGGIGTVNAWNDMGRTLVHELGHAMGLYHSFEGDNGGSQCPSGNGDYVADTDPHKRSSSNCPSGTNTCTGSPSTDVVHNYMDYSSQSCADMYFLGQADRMHYQIDFWRSSLASSITCQLEGVTDLALTEVVNDQNYQCAATYTPIVNAYNMGSDTISSIEFTYSYDGGTLSNYTWNTTLYPGESVEVSLPSETLSYSSHTLTVSADPDQVDENTANNTVTATFESIDQDPYSLEIVLDNWGSENSWEVLDNNSDVLSYGGPYENGQNGLIINEELCFPAGCNQFIFYESYGDGMGNGSYALNDDQGVEVATGWSSGNANNFPTPMFEAHAIGGPTTSVSAIDNTICQGETITLTASGGDSYSWSTGQTGSSISVSPSTTTTYSVTANLNSCQGNEAMITINVLDLPVATITPSDPEVCAGESITLTASGGTTYIWSTGDVGSTLVITPETNMTISVVPSNACEGNATSVSIDVIQIPVTTVNENEFTICEGSSLTLSAAGGESYLWNTGATSSEMVVAPSTQTNYSVTAYNATCPGNTEEILVNVEQALYAGPSSEVTFCSSENSQDLNSYLIDADEGGQWFNPQGIAVDEIFDPSIDEAGEYLYVLSSSGVCEDVSAVVNVFVDQQPNSGTSTSISVNVNSTDVNLIDFLGAADEGGVWTDPNGDNTDGIFNPSTDPEGMYVYAFNPDPPCNSNSAIVSVSITGSSNAGNDASVYFCNGDDESSLFPLLMGADAGGTWTDPDGNEFNGILDPQNDASGAYTYSIGESQAVITVTINETPVPEIYTSTDHYEVYTDILFENLGTVNGNSTWDFNDGTTSSAFSPSHQYLQAGFYNVVLTMDENGCVGSDEIALTITDITSGITEAYIENNLTISPNPGFGLFKVRFDLDKDHEVHYEVLSSNGQLIISSESKLTTSESYSIDLRDHSTGLFFYRLYVDDLVITKKLLKTE